MKIILNSMGESEASKQFNERREKLLANYFHKLRVLINGIHNKNVIDQDTVKMLIPIAGVNQQMKKH